MPSDWTDKRYLSSQTDRRPTDAMPRLLRLFALLAAALVSADLARRAALRGWI
jgi:hypothetical protein